MVKLRRIRIENFTILKEIMGKDSLEINFTDTTQIMSYNIKLQDINVLKIILGSLMMLMKLVDPTDNKHFKKYQKICYCNAETILFIGISLIQIYTYFMH